MSKVAKTLDRLLRGDADANLSFRELRNLLLHLGFAERIRGDHHIFSRDGVPEIVNLQPRGSKAKPYQVKQVRAMIGKYRLAGEPHGETTGQDTAASGKTRSEDPPESRE